MSTPLVVRKAETKQDFKTYLHFPWTIYKDNPNWVPPLLSMQKHKFDKQKSATWQHMEGEFFIAWRGDQPVGTIAAVINHRHNEFHDENIGFFGMFECIDDQEVATVLLEQAAEYIAAQGATAIRGPVNLSTNDECGLLIEGHDDMPVVLYPYNPPYYQRLIENVPGFAKVMDTYSYHFTLAGTRDSGRLERLYRVVQKNNERRGIMVRLVNVKDVKGELGLLREIYNSAWDKNWGFVPFSDRELDELIRDLGQYLEREMTFFAEVKGESAGFLLGVPDLNQALHAAYPRPGKPEVITLLQVLWHWKIRSKITRLRLPLMGVKAEFRGIGVEAAMFIELFEHGERYTKRKGIDYADGGWVLETNDDMIRLVQQHQGRQHRTFRFYQRELKKG